MQVCLCLRPKRCVVYEGMFWVLVIMSVMVAVQARDRMTKGKSGAVCEDRKRKCLTMLADCNSTTDVCDCRRGRGGNGNFACYDPGWTRIEVKNDPLVTTATGQSYTLPIPCSYQLAHFRTPFTQMANSTCECKVFAFNKKDRGKIYLHGIDIALRVSTPVSAPPTGDGSWRVIGTATGGQYHFSEHSVGAFTEDGPWPNDQTYLYVAGAYIYPRYDSYNNMFRLTVNACGFDIRFRPYDVTSTTIHSQVPGVSVAVEDRPGTVWLSQTSVMGLYPHGPRLRDLALPGSKSPSHAMIDRLFSSQVNQNQPDVSSQCSAISGVVTSCGDESARATAYNDCLFILSEPKFVRCYDNTDNGDKVLYLFRDCLEATCNRDAAKCNEVHNEVRTCQAVELFVVNMFLDKPC